jgi:hypothetical protein
MEVSILWKELVARGIRKGGDLPKQIEIELRLRCAVSGRYLQSRNFGDWLSLAGGGQQPEAYQGDSTCKG